MLSFGIDNPPLEKNFCINKYENNCYFYINLKTNSMHKSVLIKYLLFPCNYFLSGVGGGYKNYGSQALDNALKL